MSLRNKILAASLVLACVVAIAASPFLKARFQDSLAEAVGLSHFVGVLPISEGFTLQLTPVASWGSVASEIASLAFRLIIGLVFLFTTPGLLRSAREQTAPGAAAWRRVLGIGLLAWLGMLLLMLLGWGGGITPVRVAQTVTVFLGMMICIRIGGILLAFETGLWLARRLGVERPSLFNQLSLGTLVLFALTALPAVGVALAVFVNAHAIGLLVAAVFDPRRLRALVE